MDFRLVYTKIGDLEGRNGRYFAYIEFGSFGANYVKVVEDRPYCSPKSLVLAICDLWRY